MQQWQVRTNRMRILFMGRQQMNQNTLLNLLSMLINFFLLLNNNENNIRKEQQ